MHVECALLFRSRDQECARKCLNRMIKCIRACTDGLRVHKSARALEGHSIEMGERLHARRMRAHSVTERERMVGCMRVRMITGANAREGDKLRLDGKDKCAFAAPGGVLKGGIKN